MKALNSPRAQELRSQQIYKLFLIWMDCHSMKQIKLGP